MKERDEELNERVRVNGKKGCVFDGQVSEQVECGGI